MPNPTLRRRRAVLGTIAAAVLATPALFAAPATAEDFSFTGTVDGDSATWADRSDVHSVRVDQAGSITAELDWIDGGANLGLNLKDPSGTVVAKAFTSKRPETITFQATATGTYKLGVQAPRGSSTAYTLTVSTGGAPVPVTKAPAFERTIGFPAHPEIAPSGVDVDDVGALYVPSTATDEVVKYTERGSVAWRVGKRTGKINGNFSNPRDVGVAGGRVYVADTGYNRVQVLDAATGAHLATWPHHFQAAMGISAGVDGSGAPVVLVSDSTSHAVKVYTPAGVLVRTVGAGTLGSANGQFNQVRDAATDGAGNIYAADFKNQRVQVFTPTGTFVRAWGRACPGLCPAPEPGQFKEPYGVDVDAAGNVYVSDNRRVQKFTAAGVYLDEFGVTGTGPGQLFQLRRVAVGAGANPAVHLADLWGYKILRYDQAGTITRTFGAVMPEHGGFNQPYGTSINPATGTLYVADTNNQRIELFDAATGAFRTTWGERGFGKDNLNGENWPRGVTYNAATNTVWVADTKNYRVVERNLDGTPTGRVFGSVGSVLKPSVLNWAYAITSYGSDVVVADTFGNKVTRWTGNEAETPVWTATGFKNPKAITVSGNTVYVADSVNHRIVTLDARTGAQTGVLGSTVLHRIEGLAIAPNGNIWVADTSFNRLVELTPTGELVQAFGRKGSTSTTFNMPTQLSINTSGGITRLYVTDTNNDRIQVYTIS